MEDDAGGVDHRAQAGPRQLEGAGLCRSLELVLRRGRAAGEHRLPRPLELRPSGGDGEVVGPAVRRWARRSTAGRLRSASSVLLVSSLPVSTAMVSVTRLLWIALSSGRG